MFFSELYLVPMFYMQQSICIIFKLQFLATRMKFSCET